MNTVRTQTDHGNAIMRFLKKRIAVYALLIAISIAVFFLFPYDLGFLTRIIIMMIFVLSLDLILGFAGVATLGHAALYGTGAYMAGLFAVHISASPIVGLGVGALSGAVIAFISALILMRAHGLTLLMLTIAIAEVLKEIANKAQTLTGGADGLSGIVMDPIFGKIEFDFVGQTGYWYSFALLMIVLFCLHIITDSPFGLGLRGIKQSTARMRAIGAPVYWRLVAAYTVSGAIAGIAGALSAQITELVSLNVYDFSLSAEIVIMLILGGAGRLYGALLGTAVFLIVHHTAASVDPFNWLFIIGGLVLGVIFFLPGGLLSFPKKLGWVTTWFSKQPEETPR